MNNIKNILLQEARLHNENFFSYAGSITPSQGYILLCNDINIKLIDVRTKSELNWIGKVKINPSQYTEIEWKIYPENTLNPFFIYKFKNLFKNKKQILLFLCRSGERSKKAAEFVAKNGYINCFNILHGFEGIKNIKGHRKELTGWCSENLPWVGS
ncbi:rhodanese-like domain-containing protein [Candidatus Profftella armatura]|uniref:rhodanese-like domain-containing protein n=1 Tax=Candidatus Profftella armatura TaxID=669502 RepID=UPI003D993DBE